MTAVLIAGVIASLVAIVAVAVVIAGVALDYLHDDGGRPPLPACAPVITYVTTPASTQVLRTA